MIEILNKSIRVPRDLGRKSRAADPLVIHLERIEGCRVGRIGDAELLRRPRWRGHVAVEWEPHHRFALRLQALLVGSVKDSSNPTGPVTLDPWQRVDLAARWQPLEWLTLTLGIENLLNQDYEQAVGFPSPRIRPRAGVEIRLSRASISSR